MLAPRRRYVSMAELSAVNSNSVLRLAMVLKGYYDSSGKEHTGIVTLAGYIAGLDVWERFEDKWQEVLSTAPHPCTYLHMVEARARKDGFCGWSRNETRQLVNSLIKHCIYPAGWWGDRETTSLFSTFCAIADEDWQKACETIPDLRKTSKAAICAEYVTAAALFRLPQSHILELHFDRNEPFEAEIKKAWNAANNRPAGSKGPLSMITSISSVVMKASPGMQAADYLAWHVNRWHTKKGLDLYDSQWSNIKAVVPCPGVGEKLDYEGLVSWYRSPRRRLVLYGH